MLNRITRASLAVALLTVCAALSFAADGDYVSRDGSVKDSIEDHYPIPVQKPTVEEITQTLTRLLTRIEKEKPPVIIDCHHQTPITDFSTINPNARIDFGGYPYGVLHAAMLSATDATGDPRFADFTKKRLTLLGDHLDYFIKQAEQIGMAKSPLKNFLDPHNLDACGAWGAALVKANLANVGPNDELKPLIDKFNDFITHKQFRLADGTIARNRPEPQSLWGDDMYMSIPFLAQLGKMTGDPAYTNDAIKNAIQISARLFKADKGIYAHGWFADNADYQNEVYWGRANGWSLMALCELLDTLPDNHPQREQLLTILRAHIKGLSHLQSGTGLWHQLLDKPDTYLETSCTAMFAYGIAHSINKGWISPSYGAVAQTAWNGIMSRQNKEGGFDGSCIGTSFAFDNLYYYYRPAVDDEHGFGPVMLAGSEMIRLLKNPNLVIHYAKGGFYIYSTKAEAEATQF